jgi:hypothetical protein
MVTMFQTDLIGEHRRDIETLRMKELRREGLNQKRLDKQLWELTDEYCIYQHCTIWKVDTMSIRADKVVIEGSFLVEDWANRYNFGASSLMEPTCVLKDDYVRCSITVRKAE